MQDYTDDLEWNNFGFHIFGTEREKHFRITHTLIVDDLLLFVSTNLVFSDKRGVFDNQFVPQYPGQTAQSE